MINNKIIFRVNKIVILFVFLSFFCSLAMANIYTVSNSNDTGAGSLRQAITDANGSAGRDTIIFDNDYTIAPSTILPTLTEQLVIDASSGSRTITLDGPGSGGSAYDGIVIQTTSCLIKNLRVTDFKGNGFFITGDTSDENTIDGCIIYANIATGTGENGSGIYIDSADSNVIKGCYLGTLNGTSDNGNAKNGIYIDVAATSNTIGGTTSAEKNLISGNDNSGIYITGNGTNYNKIIGNYIGADINGTGSLANTNNGIYFTTKTSSNTIGGSNAGEGNIIANNGSASFPEGIRLTSPQTDYNKISRNSMYSNNGKGIGLITNANEQILAPVITTAQDLGSGSYRIMGTSSASNTIEVFVADVKTSGPGEGKTYKATGTASADGSWTVDISASAQDYVTATQTNANGSTSEFSTNIAVATLDIALRNYNDTAPYPGWDVGYMELGSYTIMTTSQCILVKNNGGIAVDFGIRASTSNWAFDSAAGIDKILLMALFNSETSPLSAEFSSNNDVVNTNLIWSTVNGGNGLYEGTSDGDNVAGGSGEKLYFYIQLPTENNQPGAQTIIITIEERAH